MYLVFDIGGTFIKYAFLDNAGNITKKSKTPTIIDYENGVQILVDTIGTIYEEYKKEEICGIAMSLPGRIDVEKGIVYGGGALPYLHKVCLGKLVSERCDNLRVSLENDGKCAALAEAWKGNAADYDDSVVVVFGTGIGGGIVKDKRIHRGKNLAAGEMSYVVGSMTREQLESVKPEDAHGTLKKMWDNIPYFWSATDATAGACYKFAVEKGLDYKKTTGEVLYEMAAKGDKDAIDFLENWYFSIAKQCCSMQAIFDPGIILIGGGISAQPLFVEGIKRYVKKMMMFTDIFEKINIDTCKFLNDSNLIGALFNYKQIYENL